jgi:transcriptional regulator with XRE-family HTH domain
LRAARESAGVSQSRLAALAGVSRALVSSIEQDRHVPAVDAALRLAQAVGASVEALFEIRRPIAAESALGERLPERRLVRAATVGERIVCIPLDMEDAGMQWAAADGIIEHGALALLPRGGVDGALILGCDPALRTAAALSDGRGGTRVVGVSATTGQALRALAGGRCHAALVHGLAEQLPRAPFPVRRWHVTRWQVGIGYHRKLGRTSLEALMGGRIRMIRRHHSAASDQALVRAARRLGITPPAGPLARGHIDSARRANWEHGAAVTYGPAARGLRLRFEPLETHVVELWAADQWSAHPGITEFLEVIGSRAFHARVGAMEGYDMAGSGIPISSTATADREANR